MGSLECVEFFLNRPGFLPVFGIGSLCLPPPLDGSACMCVMYILVIVLLYCLLTSFSIYCIYLASPSLLPVTVLPALIMAVTSLSSSLTLSLFLSHIIPKHHPTSSLSHITPHHPSSSPPCTTSSTSSPIVPTAPSSLPSFPSSTPSPTKIAQSEVFPQSSPAESTADF